MEVKSVCKLRLTQRAATVLKVKSKTTFKRETQSVSGQAGWTASPGPRDRAGIPYGDDCANR